ncbi:MAG: methyl-accepting chemotaxis protein [Kiloniellaceae bacterium]
MILEKLSLILSHMKISLRIGLLSALSAIAIVVLGAAYMVGDLQMNRAIEEGTRQSHLAQLAQQIENGALQIRRWEKDFLIRRDLKYVEKYDAASASVSEALDRMASLAVSAPIQDEIARLRAGITEHRAQFQKIVQQHEQLGLDENSGLQGTLRAAEKDVETKLKEAGLDALTVKMLMMRRHEKDFMLRGAEKYIGRIDERRQEFDALLAGEALPGSFKQEVSALMDDYQKGFHAWAAASLALAQETPLLSEIFARMGEDFDRTFEVATEGYHAAEESLEHSRDLTRLIFIIAGLVTLCFAIAASFVIGRSISRPLQNMTRTLAALAEGDTTQEVPATANKDEIGDIARAVLVFKENAIERQRLEAAQAEQQAAQAKRSETIEKMIANFDTAVRKVLSAVTTASTQLHETAETMTGAAATTSERAGAASKAADSASSNVQTVAAASEELHSAIAEIGRQVSQSNDISRKAQNEAGQTSQTMGELAEAADKIGAVINLIQDIAEQTNLLALNATIEAARAGDAGKGFAVVAGEVKSLANQTAKATEEISQQISAMQGSTTQAVSAIDRVNSTIEQMAEIATAISSAVEEQGAATNEIAKNVQEAATGTAEVTHNISNVDAATGETTQAAQQVTSLASDLSTQAGKLHEEVDGFLSSVKAA